MSAREHRGATPARTQEERRASTRAALLGATIDSLVEDGYAGTTTRRVAARAGVTPGALQHHFETRTALVTEALRELSRRLVDQMLAPAVEGTSDGRERAEALIDRLWEVHRGDLFTAYVEVVIAARTDPALAEGLESVATEMAVQIVEGAAFAFPDLVARPGFAEAVATGLATLRGLAIGGLVPGVDPDYQWPATREHLVELFERARGSDRAEA